MSVEPKDFVRVVDLLTAARAKVERLAAEVDALVHAERESIRECAASKQPLGDHYWQRRHDAELALRAARAVLEGLQ